MIFHPITANSQSGRPVIPMATGNDPYGSWQAGGWRVLAGSGNCPQGHSSHYRPVTPQR